MALLRSGEDGSDRSEQVRRELGLEAACADQSKGGPRLARAGGRGERAVVPPREATVSQTQGALAVPEGTLLNRWCACIVDIASAAPPT